MLRTESPLSVLRKAFEEIRSRLLWALQTQQKTRSGQGNIALLNRGIKT